MSTKLKKVRIAFNGDYGAKSGFGNRLKNLNIDHDNLDISIVCRNIIIIKNKRYWWPWRPISRSMQYAKRILGFNSLKRIEDNIFFRLALLGSYETLHLGNIPENLENLISSQNLVEKVIIEGFTSPDQENRIKKKFSLNEPPSRKKIPKIQCDLTILCPSEWSKNSYEHPGSKLTTVKVLYPYDLRYSKKNRIKPSFSILVPVALKESKGLRIIDKIAEYNPDLTFEVCGRKFDGLLVSNFLMRANVNYHGFVNIKNFVCNRNFLALVPTLFEGSNNTIVELSLLGVPSIFFQSAGIDTSEMLPNPLNFSESELIEWMNNRVKLNKPVQFSLKDIRQTATKYNKQISRIYLAE